MTIHAWRIVKARHAAAAFTGEGARRFGARWNSPGMAAVYLSGSAALAMLEMLVHLDADQILRRYVLFDVTFDESLVTTLDSPRLPRSWQKSPPPPAIQQIGGLWIERARSAVLRVPSAIVPAEWNYLLNPAHPDFRRIRIGPKQPIQFDPRLLKPGH